MLPVVVKGNLYPKVLTETLGIYKYTLSFPVPRQYYKFQWRKPYHHHSGPLFCWNRDNIHYPALGSALYGPLPRSPRWAWGDRTWKRWSEASWICGSGGTGRHGEMGKDRMAVRWCALTWDGAHPPHVLSGLGWAQQYQYYGICVLKKQKV